MTLRRVYRRCLKSNMKINKNRCVMCGLCVRAYPKIFKFSDDYSEIVVIGDGTNYKTDVCPGGAIKR
jgi:ferredoxin